MTALTLSATMAVAVSVPAAALTATSPAAGSSTASVYAYDPVVEARLDTQLAVAGEAGATITTHEGYAVEAAPPPVQSTAAATESGTGTDAAAESRSEADGQPVILTGSVVWPVGHARISDGFGYRSDGCPGCSAFHDGTDFVPGASSPISAMADGIVVMATDGGGLGSHVTIEHNIDGELVSSTYAHMQYGSRTVSVGDYVSAGHVLGAVGSTGQSTGPHLHLEIFGGDGARIDPYAWLSTHAG